MRGRTPRFGEYICPSSDTFLCPLPPAVTVDCAEGLLCSHIATSWADFVCVFTIVCTPLVCILIRYAKVVCFFPSNCVTGFRWVPLPLTRGETAEVQSATGINNPDQYQLIGDMIWHVVYKCV